MQRHCKLHAIALDLVTYPTPHPTPFTLAVCFQGEALNQMLTATYFSTLGSQTF